jgi:hypothetical protein
MHHLPISKESQGAVFCDDAWVDEGVRGGGSARRSSLISLVIFGRVWETICGAGLVVAGLGRDECVQPRTLEADVLLDSPYCSATWI